MTCFRAVSWGRNLSIQRRGVCGCDAVLGGFHVVSTFFTYVDEWGRRTIVLGVLCGAMVIGCGLFLGDGLSVSRTTD